MYPLQQNVLVRYLLGTYIFMYIAMRGVPRYKIGLATFHYNQYRVRAIQGAGHRHGSMWKCIY